MSDTSYYNKKYVFKVTLIIGIGTLNFGFNLGSSNSIVPYLQNVIFPDESKFLVNLAGTLFFFGAGVGSVLAGYLASIYGRRKSMIMSDIGTIITAVLTMSTNIYLLLLGKLGIGILSGSNSILNPLYLTETAPPAIRGKIGTTSHMVASFGVFLSYCMGLNMPAPGVEGEWWRVFSICVMGLSIIRLLFLTFIFLYDSPFYLVIKEKYSEALDHLRLIYDDRAQDELDKMKELKKTTRTTESPSIFKVLQSEKRTSFIYGCIISSFFTASGINLFMIYSSSIFATSSVVDPSIFSFRIGLLAFLMTLFAPYTIERLGRKMMLAFGNISIGIILTTIVIFSFFGLNSIIEYLMYLFVICYAPTLGSVIWVYLTDILEDVLFSYVKIFGWINSFIATTIFPSLVQSFGLGGAMLVFAVWTFINGYFTIFKLKETKGLSKFESLHLFDDHELKGKNHIEFNDEL
jgi:MFS transporter, SP family, arabinose:H+ symporter